MNEDRCEDCWYFYGVPVACHLPAFADDEDQAEEYTKLALAGEPCGYFEPKVEKKEPDEYEAYQRMWN